MATPAKANLSIRRIGSIDDAREEIQECRDIIDSVAQVLELEALAQQEDPSAVPYAFNVTDRLQHVRFGLIRAIQAAVFRFDEAQEAIGRLSRHVTTAQAHGPHSVKSAV